MKHSSASLKVFTEKGLYMLATILKSPKAVETTLAIIDTFAKVRELSYVMHQIQSLPEGRVNDLKRQYSMTVIARETAEKKSQERNAKKSVDWLTHNDKKLTILSKQLADNNITEFDPHQS